MKSIASSLVLLVAVLMSGAASARENLSFKQSSLLIHASFPIVPAVGSESLLVLEAIDEKTRRAVALSHDIEVVLWMPSMGHGSAPTQVERAVDAKGNLLVGVYNVRNVYFIMGGDWEVRVSLTDAQGVRETQSFKLSISGAGLSDLAPGQISKDQIKIALRFRFGDSTRS